MSKSSDFNVTNPFACWLLGPAWFSPQQNSRSLYCGRPQQLGTVLVFAPSEICEPYSGGKAFVPCAYPDLDLPSDAVREVETRAK